MVVTFPRKLDHMCLRDLFAELDRLPLAILRFVADGSTRYRGVVTRCCFAGDGKCSEHLTKSLEEY
jgi:hypothetical protein